MTEVQRQEYKTSDDQTNCWNEYENSCLAKYDVLCAVRAPAIEGVRERVVVLLNATETLIAFG